MKTYSYNLVAAACLTAIMFAGLVWFVISGKPAGSILVLIYGTVMGMIYCANGGKLPDAIIGRSNDKLTADDDPRNISFRVYLPIILTLLFLFFLAVLWMIR